MKPMRNAPQALALEFMPGSRSADRKGWVLLAIAVVLCLAATIHLYLQQKEINALRAELARLGARQPGLPVKPVLTLQDPAQARKVSDRLDADWGGMLAALARPLQPGLGIHELRADAGRGTLHITGEAPSLELAFEYVGKLQGQAGLQGMTIDSYVWPQGPNTGSLNFTASGRWGGRP